MFKSNMVIVFSWPHQKIGLLIEEMPEAKYCEGLISNTHFCYPCFYVSNLLTFSF